MKILQILAVIGLITCGYGQEVKSQPSPPIQKEKISGVVKDEQGKPIKGAFVEVSTAKVRTGTSTLCPSCYPDCRKSTVTDDAGHFEISNMAADLLFSLVICAPGYVPTGTGALDPKDSPASITLKKRASSVVGSEMKGTVTDQDGHPVSGAQVSPYGFCIGSDEIFWGTTRLESLSITDEKGDFSLMVDKKYDGVMLHISARGLASKKFPNTPLDNKVHQFKMDPGVMVIGHLVHEGKPVANEEVGLMVKDRSNSKFFDEVVVPTGKDGRFIFSNVPPNREYFIYGLRGTLKDRGVTQSKKITTGESESTLDAGNLELESGRIVSGTVILSDGKSIPPGTRLQIDRQEAWDAQVLDIGSDGKFTLRTIPNEKLDLLIWINGYTLEGATDTFHRSIQFVSDRDTIELKFTRLPKLQGKVMNSEGKIATNAEISLIPESTSGIAIVDGKVWPPSEPKPVHSDTEGKFELPISTTLSTNNCILAVNNEGYALVPEVEFQGAMTLTPWCKLEGKAFLGNLPATNCIVAFERVLHGSKDIGWYFPLFNNGEVDSSGRFTINKIPEGLGEIALYRKTDQKSIFEILRKKISISRQGVNTITLGGVGTTISGAVILPHELSTQTNRYQMLYAENDPTHQIHIFSVRHDGTFEIQNVPPGQYRMNISFEKQGRDTVDGRAATNITVTTGVQTLTLPPLKLQNHPPVLNTGDSFPSFSAVTTDGRTISNQDLKGKVTLLYFDLNTGRGRAFEPIVLSENWKDMRKLSDKFQLITFRPKTSLEEPYSENDPRRLPGDACLFDPSKNNDLAKILGIDYWDAFYVVNPDGRLLLKGNSQNEIWESIQNALSENPASAKTPL